MALLDILHFPDPRLRNVARPVTVVDDTVRQLVDDMFETMYAAPGIGLAATQVNVDKRVVVIDVSEEKDQPLCLINPEILERRGEEEMEEGCLSVPELVGMVERAEKIKVTGLDREGEPVEMEAEGLAARIIQHEIDHLDGVLFVDRLGAIKRKLLVSKWNKIRKELV